MCEFIAEYTESWAEGCLPGWSLESFHLWHCKDCRKLVLSTCPNKQLLFSAKEFLLDLKIFELLHAHKGGCISCQDSWDYPPPDPCKRGD